MKDFNLEYEANFIVKNWLISSDEYNRTHYPHFICFANNTDMSIRDYNAQYGIFGRNCWIHIDTTKPVLSYVSTRKILKKIISHRPGERIVLDSHPMYFGYSFKRNILSALARVTELVI